ncbi:MAG: hypothetical protein HY211_06265 [Candidatus Omnitrophica bacterium]|nr:hypothetical protein [Candidatus Omnitrophota bacterium]
MPWVDEKGRFMGRVNLIDALAAAVGLLFLLPMAYYGYRNLSGWDLEIESVNPAVIQAGKGGALSIFGRNFNKQSTVRLGNHRLADLLCDKPRNILAKVPSSFPPGQYPLIIENPQGGKAVLEKGVVVVGNPVILEVQPKRFLATQETLVTLTGKNFDSAGTVRVGPLIFSKVEFLSPERLRIKIHPEEILPGRYLVFVDDRYGYRSSEKIHIDAVGGGVVIAALIWADEKQSSLLRSICAQWESRQPEQIRIVDILEGDLPTNPIPVKELGKKSALIANVVLPDRFLELADPMTYLYQGKPLVYGADILLPMPEVTLKAKVISKPISLSSYDRRAFENSN